MSIIYFLFIVIISINQIYLIENSIYVYMCVYVCIWNISIYVVSIFVISIFIVLVPMNWFSRIVFRKFPFAQEYFKNRFDNHFPSLLLLVISSQHIQMQRWKSRCRETSKFFSYRSITVYLPRNYTIRCAHTNSIIWPKVHVRWKNRDFLSLSRFRTNTNTLYDMSWYPRWYMVFPKLFFFKHKRILFSRIFLCIYIFNIFS